MEHVGRETNTMPYYLVERQMCFQITAGKSCMIGTVAYMYKLNGTEC